MRPLCPTKKMGGIKEVKAQIVVYFVKRRPSHYIPALEDILYLPVQNTVICIYAKLGMFPIYLNRPVADTRKHIASRVTQRTIGVIGGN